MFSESIRRREARAGRAHPLESNSAYVERLLALKAHLVEDTLRRGPSRSTKVTNQLQDIDKVLWKHMPGNAMVTGRAWTSAQERTKRKKGREVPVAGRNELVTTLKKNPRNKKLVESLGSLYESVLPKLSAALELHLKKSSPDRAPSEQQALRQGA